MSWAGEARGRHDWYPNSYRFDAEDEAKRFIHQLKERWIPRGFMRSTRTLWSREPVNARWNATREEAIRLAIPIPTAVPAPEDDQEDLLHHLVDETSYRARKKLPRRVINRELFRQYRDETRWSDKEQEVLLIDALRHDIRHLLAHGDCRYELSQHLYQAYQRHQPRAFLNSEATQ
jgi:hypothetical protein